MSYACISNYNGQPTIMVDGKAYPPMAMTTRIKKDDYIKSLGEAGIKIFFLMTNTNWLRPGNSCLNEQGEKHNELNGFGAFSQEAEALLAMVPDAYIIVRIGMHPPVDWVEAHKDDIMKYNDGSFKPAILSSEVHEDLLPGMYSLCSQAWREDGSKALIDFCNDVEKLPYSDRIIGYFLAAGGTSEWYPINPLTDYENNVYGDFSPSFKQEFSKILKEKYGSADALKKAWNNCNATFENPIIPDIPSRLYTKVDELILDALLNYESADRIIGKKIELNPENETCLGVFLNADKYQNVADFYYAWHRGTANTIIHFANTIKNNYSGKLVGAFYGSYGCTNFFDVGTAGAVLPIMDSGVVDFLAAPGVYNNREPGGYVAQREMQDSFRLRNQMFVVEEDSRTHLENSFYRDSMQLYNIEDSLNTLKRDFARNICEDIFAWWFDQHADSGRYMHDQIYKLFKRQQEISAYAYSINREKKNEIALIYDQESIHYVSQHTSELILDYYRTSDLGRIGAPVDYYFHNDMSRADMPDYKMYLMINTFCLTTEECNAIKNKAAKNGATVVWLYAPGFINPSQNIRMDNKYIEELTGIKVRRIDSTCSSRFKVIKENHPALEFADRDRLYGYIDRDVHSNVWLGNVISPPYMNPSFYIDDPAAEILGYYCNNSKAALAIKKISEGWTSVYSAPQILRSELLASLAKYSGCHLYVHTDDCIYANENFVTVHANFTGKRTIYFKNLCSPYEVYKHRYYGQNIKQIELFMHRGETMMFCVAGKV